MKESQAHGSLEELYRSPRALTPMFPLFSRTECYGINAERLLT